MRQDDSDYNPRTAEVEIDNREAVNVVSVLDDWLDHAEAQLSVLRAHPDSEFGTVEGMEGRVEVIESLRDKLKEAREQTDKQMDEERAQYE